MTGASLDKKRIQFAVRHAWRFFILLSSQFYRDHCIQISAALTYTTLLAVVPMLSVAFSIINNLTIYPELLQGTQDFIINTFTPGVGEELREHLLRFVTNVARVSHIGFVALIVVVLMALNTFDKALNRIWKVTNRRHTLFSLIVYMLVMLIGPVLIGISLAVSTYVASLPVISDAVQQLRWLNWLPLLTTFLAFSAIYRWVPNIHVAWRYALPGGAIAALMFELAKHGFTMYLTWFPNYEIIYGALVMIPLTLIWIHLSWLIILVGAEITRCLAIYGHATQAKSRLLTTLYHLLIDIYLAGEQGLDTGRVGPETKREQRRINAVLRQLHERGLVRLEGQQCWATDKLSELGFVEVYDVLREYTLPGARSVQGAG